MENPRDHIQNFFEDAIVPILEKEGYTLKAVDLSDLQTADVALNDGDVDVNVEQHTAYMDSFNQSYNADLVAISPIPTVPAGVYSEKYDSVDEIPMVRRLQSQMMRPTQHAAI